MPLDHASQVLQRRVLKRQKRARNEEEARDRKRRKCAREARAAPQPSEAAKKRAWAATLAMMETKLRAEEVARGEFSAGVRLT